ncbi:hypothetical protein AMTR_s00053p00104520, partial [Amborella trichopoda]
VVDEYQKNFGESWRTMHTDANQPWPYISEALTKYQDPAEADKLLKIQRDLDETKIILHKTIDSVLERGEKLDSLVEKSSDLSAASQLISDHSSLDLVDVTMHHNQLDFGVVTLTCNHTTLLASESFGF